MKSLTLVLCVVAILGSAASTFFYFQIGDTKNQLQQQVTTAESRTTEVEGELAKTKSQTEELLKRLSALDTDLGDAKSKVTTAENRAAQLTRETTQLRAQLTEKTDAEKALNDEISGLKRELAQAKLSVSSATPEEIDGYKNTIATLQARVNELESAQQNAVANTSATTRGANTTAPAASGSTARPAASTITGQVVSIGAQNGFVVLNVGSAQGVQSGQTFSITRNGNQVATGKISTVQENLSIAQIAVDSLRGGLLKGDTASLTQ